MSQCFVCGCSWTEWETRCGEWVCTQKCHLEHIKTCSWCFELAKPKEEVK